MPRKKGPFETSQPDTRRFNRWYDQHGRTWEGVLDMKNGFPIGRLNPVGWDAPLLPDQKYFRFHSLDNRFTIDYRRMIEDFENSRRIYNRRRQRYARKLFGERAGEILRNGSAELDREVGVQPQPIEPILAMAQGNKWILGLVDIERKPAWAEQFFPEKEETEDTLVRFPDVDDEDDDGDEFVFDMDSISPEKAAFLEQIAAEEAELEAEGELDA